VTRPAAHLGILAGLRSEAACLSRCLPPEDELKVSVALSGARSDGALAGSKRLVADGATHLLSFGLAGALDPALTAGTLMLPDRIVQAGGIEHRSDPVWHAQLAELFHDQRPVIGPHLGADQAVASAGAKSALFAAMAVRAVDMESHILAAAAAAAGLPFAAIRVICDDAGTALPPAALAAIRLDGSTDLLAIALSVLRAPRQIPALRRLGRAAAQAEAMMALCGRRIALIGLGLPR
jgi:adenosylhomocysteine nucleosidase